MLERVIMRLNAPDIDLMRVARETGLKYSWLYHLRKGRFHDPGIRKIEQLDNYFRTGVAQVKAA